MKKDMSHRTTGKENVSLKKTFADECIERAEKATPGPWWVEPKRQGMRDDGTYFSMDMGVVYGRKGDLSETYHLYKSCNKDDYDFIAHAREDVPELCRRLKMVCDSLAILKGVLERKMSMHPDWVQELIEELEAPLGEK